MSINADVQEIIDYLESNDLEIVKHFKNTVQEKLYTSRDQNLLGALTDRYVQTKSETLLELLIGINDQHAMCLFEKLNDHLKRGQLIEVCTLLFSVVKKQPSWLHKIVGTSLFGTFLKCLKNDSDIVFIMSGIIILCTLIPCVPAIIRSHHGDILEVFVRTAGIILNKSGAIPEICIMHLHIGVYILFHRLYAMYPNNFLSYMKSCFAGQQKKDPIFQLVIKPMFEFVKFHPDLITETPKSETALEKWKVFQPHDILADCQKLSLDPADSVKEAKYAVFSQHTVGKTSCRNLRDSDLYLGLNSIFSHPDTNLYSTPIKKGDAEVVTSEHKPLIDDSSSFCNPSEVCGLTTPPSSRPLSPSNSTPDISSINTNCKQSPGELDLRGSLQNLTELGERKSSGETRNSSPGSKRSDVKKTYSFGSSDNVNPRSLLKNWLPGSASHSTPMDKEVVKSRQSAPASPRKSGGSKGQPNRPNSTEFFKHKIVKQLNLGGSGHFGVQSAPTSPMVHAAPHSSEQQQFSFNITPELEMISKLPDKLSDAKDAYKAPYHKVASPKDKQNEIKDPENAFVSLKLIQSIKDMFSELCPKTTTHLDDPTDATAETKPSVQAYKLKSPLTLLDDFVKYGSDVHSFQLSRIPLTSQLETNWTYFGGSTPVDELKILQTQVHMLHIQLLYERQKCELHCFRNRRLFGSLQNSHTLQYELKALKDQIALTACTLHELKHSNKLKYDENRGDYQLRKRFRFEEIIREDLGNDPSNWSLILDKVKPIKGERHIRQQAVAREQECLKKINELERVNKTLEFKLKNSKDKKKELKRKNEKFQKEVNKLKYQLFETTQEILNTQPKLSEIDRLQTMVETLQKDLLAQSEKQELVEAKIEDFQVKNYRHVELQSKLVAHRNELKVFYEEKDMLKTQIESLKVKVSELEASNAKKDKLIREHKTDLRNIREKHKDKIEVLHERFHSCRKTCQSLQSYITSLFAKLEECNSSESSRKLSSHSSRHSSPSNQPNEQSTHIPWNSHKCKDKGCKCTSFGSHSSHHDHSHRHSIPSSRFPESTPKDIHGRRDPLNPFSRSRSQTGSVSGVDDSLKKPHDVEQDSGIERSSDVISQKRNSDQIEIT